MLRCSLPFFLAVDWLRSSLVDTMSAKRSDAAIRGDSPDARDKVVGKRAGPRRVRAPVIARELRSLFCGGG